jgi:hypothetical protein
LTRQKISAITFHMDTSQLNLTKWSDRLCFDIALMLEGSGETLPELIVRHGITTHDVAAFSKDPIFSHHVDAYRTEVREKGLTFKVKARAQAEELLTTSWKLIHDRDVSAAVKADLIKSTVKWAGLEPKGDVGNGDAGANGGVRITINLGGTEHEATYTGSTINHATQALD